MPLNIKDEKVHEAAKQLAELTGQSITSAVRSAIMEKLRRAERQAKIKSPEITAASILALGRECAVHMKSGAHSSDHSELYGPDGMPS